MRNLKRYNDLIRSLSALKTEKEVINVKIKEVEDEIKQIEEPQFEIAKQLFNRPVCKLCGNPMTSPGLCSGCIFTKI